MAEKKHIESALRACAEQGVPETAVPWSEIRERALAERGDLSDRKRFMPRTRVGWVLAAVAMTLVFGTGAYAISEIAYKEFRLWLPGVDRGEVVGVPIDQTRTIEGVKVTIERAYADERYVAISYSVEDLEGRRYIDAGLQLTDEGGNKFTNVDGQLMSGGISEPAPGAAVFRAGDKISPDDRHRFNVEVPLAVKPVPSQSSQEDRKRRFEGMGDPLMFEFEVPVRPIPIIETDESDTASGMTLTLERIENSPARPEAIVCFGPPDDKNNYNLGAIYGNSNEGLGFDPAGDVDLKVPGKSKPVHLLARGGRVGLEGRGANDDCEAVPLIDRGAGEYSLLVPAIQGLPKDLSFLPEDGDEATETLRKELKTIRGPWRLDFRLPESEVPEP